MSRHRKLVMTIDMASAKKIVKELNGVQRRWSYFWTDEQPGKDDKVRVYKIPNELEPRGH